MKHCTPKKTVYSALLALAVLPLAPAASAHQYTWLEGGYVNLDRGRFDDSGLRLAGSVSLTPSVALVGEYADVGDYSQLSAGGLFHTPINSELNLVLGASVEYAEASRDDDTGLGLRGGVHWRPAGARYELQPEARLLDVFGDTLVSPRMGALFEIAPRLDLSGAVQAGDDDRLEVGLRYRFGP